MVEEVRDEAVGHGLGKAEDLEAAADRGELHRLELLASDLGEVNELVGSGRRDGALGGRRWLDDEVLGHEELKAHGLAAGRGLCEG